LFSPIRNCIIMHNPVPNCKIPKYFVLQGVPTMKKELQSYIETLTAEQVDKLINCLPQLSELLAESSQPCHLEQIEQTA